MRALGGRCSDKRLCVHVMTAEAAWSETRGSRGKGHSFITVNMVLVLL